MEINDAEVRESIGNRYLSYFTLLYRKLNSLAETRYTYLYLSLSFLLVRKYLSVNGNYNYLIKQRPRFSDALIINKFKNPKVPPLCTRCIRMFLNSKHKNKGYRGIFRLALKYVIIIFTIRILKSYICVNL